MGLTLTLTPVYFLVAALGLLLSGADAANLQQLHKLLYTYKLCANENNLTYPTNFEQGLGNDILWVLGDYGLVMSCVEDRRQALQASEIPEQWYLAYMFNDTFALQQQADVMGIIQVSSLACLDDAGLNSGLTQCLSETGKSISTAYHSQNLFIPGEAGTVSGICKLVKDPVRCADELSPVCSSGVKTVLRALMKTFAGNRCQSLKEKKPVVTEAPEVTRMSQTGVHSCGVIYDIDSSLIFPRTQAEVRAITDLSQAHTDYRRDVEKFCSKQREYPSCVQEVLKKSQNQWDVFLQTIMATDTLDQTMASLCDNKQLLFENYLCAVQAVNETDTPCWSGMEDVLEDVDNQGRSGLPPLAIRPMACSRLVNSIQCRSKVLAGCSIEYSKVLTEDYLRLFGKGCELPKPVFGFLTFLSDLFYSPVLSECMEIFRPSQATVTETVTVELTNWLKAACSNRAAFSTCLASKNSTTSSVMEKILFSILSLNGIESSLDMICSKQADFLEVAVCLPTFAASPEGQECHRKLAPISGLVQEANMNRLGIDEKAIHSMCSALSLSGQCYADLVARTCEKKTFSLFHEVLRQSLNVCPRYPGEDGGDAGDGDEDSEPEPENDFPLLSVCANEHIQVDGHIPETPSKQELPALISRVINAACPTGLSAFWDCVYQNHDDWSDPTDGLLWEVLDLSRLKSAASETCDLLQGLEPSSECLVQQLGDSVTEDWFVCTNVTLRLPFLIAESESSQKIKVTEFCSFLEELVNCLSLKVAVCAPSLELSFKEVATKLLGCHDSDSSTDSDSSEQSGGTAGGSSDGTSRHHTVSSYLLHTMVAMVLLAITTQ